MSARARSHASFSSSASSSAFFSSGADVRRRVGRQRLGDGLGGRLAGGHRRVRRARLGRRAVGVVGGAHRCSGSARRRGGQQVWTGVMSTMGSFPADSTRIRAALSKQRVGVRDGVPSCRRAVPAVYALAPMAVARDSVAASAAASGGGASQPCRWVSTRSVSAAIHSGWSLRQGMAWNSRPPAATKVALPSMPISSSVSRQSATKPGTEHVDPADALLAQRRQHRRGVRLQPLRLAEARLEGHRVLRRGEAQLGHQQPRRLVAVAVVGVAQVEHPARQAVEAQHQLVRPAVLHPVIVHAWPRAPGCTPDRRESSRRRAGAGIRRAACAYA